MSTRPKPDRHGGRAPEPDLSPEEEAARVRRLVESGLLLAPEEPGEILEEMLTPGPSCPGAAEALIEDRRSRP